MKYIKKDIISIILLLLLLLSANFYTFIFADAMFEGLADRCWYVLVTGLGYVVGLSLFRLRTFFIIAGVAQMIILPIEVSSIYLNGESVSMPFMNWIISTNSREAYELLSSVWWLVLIVIVVWSLYGWLVTNINDDTKALFYQKWSGFVITMVMMVTLLFINALQLNKNYTAPNKRVYVQIFAWAFGMRMGNVFPYDIYLQTYRAFKHQREIDGVTSLSNFRFGIMPRNDTDSVLYVLVIGEAARYQNFSLNGEYERETNPLLSHQPNLVLYTRAYAEANATDLSVPLMITRASAEDPIRAYNEKTIGGAFQEAGYKIAWLSADASPIRYLQHVLPSFDTTWIASSEVLDEALLEPFWELINFHHEFSNNSLIILHTIGSHLNYQDRYPESFAVFEPCLKRGISQGSFDKTLMTNTYDNSILYTDYLLKSLIQMISATNRCACLIYMPDHGENLCDDERKLWVHGSFEGSEWEYHVPLLVWYSDKYQEKYPNKVKALIKNKDKRVTSKVLFYTLCDMADLQEVVDNRYNLMSDSLSEEETIRVLNGRGEIIEPF